MSDKAKEILLVYHIKSCAMTSNCCFAFYTDGSYRDFFVDSESRWRISEEGTLQYKYRGMDKYYTWFNGLGEETTIQHQLIMAILERELLV